MRRQRVEWRLWRGLLLVHCTYRTEYGIACTGELMAPIDYPGFLMRSNAGPGDPSKQKRILFEKAVEQLPGSGVNPRKC